MKLVAVSVFMIIGLGGCATVTRGATSQMQIDSEPSGASVKTSLAHACTTPCTIQVSRKDEFAIEFSKPGYQTARIDVKTQVASAGVAGFAGNIVAGGIVGMGVDAATGSPLEHVPNPAKAVLQPERAAVQPSPPPRQRARRPVS